MTELLRRLAGYVLVIGGALGIVGYLAAGIVGGSGDPALTDPQWQPVYAIALAGGILVVVGHGARDLEQHQAIRQAERQLAEQAEVSHKRLVKDQQSKAPARKVRASATPERA